MMRWPARLLLLASFFVLLVVSLAPPVAAPPPIPMRTDGLAFDRTGNPLAIGTPIRTFVDGVDYSNLSTVHAGTGSFSVLTVGNSKSAGDLSDTPEVLEGPNLADEVIFAAGDFTGSTPVFRETLPWSPGAVVSQDLNLGSVATTPLPIKIQGIVTRPAQRGNQYVVVCNPTGGSVSLSDYYLQLNEPGRYDGPALPLAGILTGVASVEVDLPSDSFLDPRGDALKLVYRNPGGALPTAGGRDIVVDRIEFNATVNGALFWEPGNTILPDAPAPGLGRILERSPTCADTNEAGDFRIAVEPGLPASNEPPTVVILSPTQGQSITKGTPFTITWSMSDDIFLPEDLRVWVNITIGPTNMTLLNDSAGQTSVVWAPPDEIVIGVVIRVEVVDPFEARGGDSRTVNVTEPTLDAVLVAVLMVTILLAFLLLGLVFALRARRTLPRPPPGPAVAPGPTPPGAAGAPAQALPGRKLCPRCHTAVGTDDLACFYCGHRFAEPPRGAP